MLCRSGVFVEVPMCACDQCMELLDELVNATDNMTDVWRSLLRKPFRLGSGLLEAGGTTRDLPIIARAVASARTRTILVPDPASIRTTTPHELVSCPGDFGRSRDAPLAAGQS